MRFLQSLLVLAAAAVLGMTAATQPVHGGDILYIGDGGDNTVKRFNAQTGAPLDHSVRE